MTRLFIITGKQLATLFEFLVRRQNSSSSIAGLKGDDKLNLPAWGYKVLVK